MGNVGFGRKREKLLAACKSGRVEHVRYLVEEEKCNPKCRDNLVHWSCVQWAAFSGHTNVVKYLLATGKVDPNAWTGAEKERDTLLHWYIHRRHLPMIKLLIASGANPKTTDKYGTTPLLMAVQTSMHFETVDFLLENKASLEETDKKGRSALVWASFLGKTGMVNHLIKRGATVEYKGFSSSLLNDSDDAFTNIMGPWVRKIIVEIACLPTVVGDMIVMYARGFIASACMSRRGVEHAHCGFGVR